MCNILLIYCRQHAGYTRVETASYLHIPLKDYTDIEAGRKYLSLQQAARLEALFGVPSYQLFIAGLQVEVLRCIGELMEMRESM